MESDAFHSSLIYEILMDFHLAKKILPFQLLFRANIQNLFFQMFSPKFFLSIDEEICILFPCKNSLQLKSTIFPKQILWIIQVE